jgi:phage repressor protein C with HTH and peptisase S24 domain
MFLPKSAYHTRYMPKRLKRTSLPEWALQITTLRERLEINQAELARRMQCSAMTISRWERGLLQPSAEHFIQLGNLGSKTDAWFFWEMAGIQPAKMVEALSGSSRAKRILDGPQIQPARAGSQPPITEKVPTVVGLPLLKVVIGTHGVPGDKRTSLRTIPANEVVGVPSNWCPNPAYTSLLRVKGTSMEPLIRNGDIVAVDSYQTERSDLYGTLVIAANEEAGLSVSRLRRYDGFDVLEAENRQYDPIVLNKARDFRIVGKVLWWLSGAP